MKMENNGLGRTFDKGQNIFKQGDIGDRMYVIQSGLVEVIITQENCDHILAVLGQGEFFGEMALFNKVVRMASVRAIVKTRVLSVDRRSLMRWIYEDPSLVYRMLMTMSQRIRELSEKVVQLNQQDEDQYGVKNGHP